MTKCEDFKNVKDDNFNIWDYCRCTSKAKYLIKLEKGMLVNGKMQIKVCGVHKTHG